MSGLTPLARTIAAQVTETLFTARGGPQQVQMTRQELTLACAAAAQVALNVQTEKEVPPSATPK